MIMLLGLHSVFETLWSPVPESQYMDVIILIVQVGCFTSSKDAKISIEVVSF